MARAVKAGDKSYDARRRYYRDAQRKIRDAAKAKGANAKRLMHLARQSFDKALATYDFAQTQKLSKPMQELAEKFGVDVQEIRKKQAESLQYSDKRVQQYERKQKQLISEEESKKFTVKGLTEDERKEAEARAIFNSSVGKNIIGGLVDVWRDKAIETYIDEEGIKRNRVNKQKMMQAIYDYFGVSKLSEVLKKMEDAFGDVIYSTGAPELYETVKLLVQIGVKSNAFVV